MLEIPEFFHDALAFRKKNINFRGNLFYISNPSVTTVIHSILLPAFFLFVLMSCTSDNRSANPEEASDDKAAEWFDQKEWLGKTQLEPDASIDKKDLAAHYREHKDRWDKAFAFLTKTNLDSLPAGTYEIDGKNVYAMVQQYTSKNPEDAQYESHKNYTDIQHVISGTELIGHTDLSTTEVKTPYDADKDIAFYTSPEGHKLTATPRNFFIFFPDDAHMPGLKVDQNMPVKKLVIKVRNN